MIRITVFTLFWVVATCTNASYDARVADAYFWEGATMPAKPPKKDWFTKLHDMVLPPNTKFQEPETAPMVRSVRRKSFISYREDEPIHICLFSDRLEAMTVPVRSVLEKTKNPKNVNIWIVTVHETYEKFSNYFHDHKAGFLGAQIHVLDLNQVTQELIAEGVQPVWKWKQFGSSTKPTWTKTKFSVEPVTYDRDNKHMHPLNHLRFYLAYMPQFKNVEKIILMDDDVVIQGDIAEFYSLPVPEEQSLVTNCYKWRYHYDKDAMMHSDPKYSEGQIAANFLLLRFKNSSPEKKAQLVTQLAAIHKNITGDSIDIMKLPYWNFGLTLFDLGNWRRQQLTGVYQHWMLENYKRRIFQETTLSFGLGIPFLALLGRVSCLPHDVKVLDGCGWLPFKVIEDGGYKERRLPDMFALHYNGWWKPWEEKGAAKLHAALKTPWEKVQTHFDKDMFRFRQRRAARHAKRRLAKSLSYYP